MLQRVDLLGAITRVVPERTARPIDIADLQRLLVVKLSSIGDVVHALPVASALKRRFPALRITWAVEHWTAPLVAGHRAVDRVVTFPPMMGWPEQPRAWWRDMRAAVRALRLEEYDAALDLQGLAKSALITALSRAPRRLARAGQREGAHLVSSAVPLPDSPIHAVDEYLIVARALGAEIDPVEFALPVSEGARASMDARLASAGIAKARPLIVVNPSAAQSWKQWPATRWSDVIGRLADRAPVVMTGSAAQAAAHREIARRARGAILDLSGSTTLAEVVALIERADLHVAPDTGTVHIAVALGTPVVAVYGPTSRTRVGPYRQCDGVVAHDDLCGRLCPAYCRYGRRCLDAVTSDEIVQRAWAVLDARRRSAPGEVGANRRAGTASSDVHSGTDTA